MNPLTHGTMPAGWVNDESKDISNELTVWRNGMQRITDKRIILDDNATMFLKDLEDAAATDNSVIFMSHHNNIVFSDVPNPEGIVELVMKMAKRSFIESYESICRCGTSNIGGSRFCNQCGFPLR